MGDDDELMTVPELSLLLKVPQATLYHWRYTGDGPAGLKIGRHVRYRRVDVEAWLNGLGPEGDGGK